MVNTTDWTKKLSGGLILPEFFSKRKSLQKFVMLFKLNSPANRLLHIFQANRCNETDQFIIFKFCLLQYPRKTKSKT